MMFETNPVVTGPYRLASIGLCVSLLFILPGAAEREHSPGNQPDTSISWYPMKQAQNKAAETDKLVYVYAYAEWCVYCKKMEEEVFTRKTVQLTLEKYYYPVKVDIDSDGKLTFNGRELTGRDFAGTLRVSATPTSFFIDGKGNILGKQPGFIPHGTFNTLLSYVGTGAYKEQKFTEYREALKRKDGNREQ